MSAILLEHRERTAPAPEHPPVPHRRRPKQSRLLPLSLGLAFMAGTTLLCFDYSYAVRHPTGPVVFGLFWAAELVVLLPVGGRVLTRTAAPSERLALVAAFGLYEFLAKVLRNPVSPLFHDEFAHWHQAEAIYQTGHPFVGNSLLPIIEYFPGLHILTVALRDLTGLSSFRAGTVLLGVLHVVSVLGVWQLAGMLTRSDRARNLAALIYAVNPAFMFFDSQYSYESLAVVFVIWALVAAVGLVTSGGDRGKERTWLAVGVVVAAGSIVTHHISTYFLCLALISLVLGCWLVGRRHPDRPRESLRGLVLFTGIVISGAAAWLVLVAGRTIPYLSPHVVPGVTGLLRLIDHEQHGRTLFEASPVPAYERVAAFAAPVLLGVGFLLAVRQLLRGRRVPRTRIGVGAFGLLYFLSLPFMLTAQNEGARRSWAFSYLGLAVLLAPALVAALDRVRRRRTRVLSVGGLVAALAVVLVGNVSADLNTEFRFPGPYVYGSDTRSITPEVVATADWFRSVLGSGNRVVATRDDGLAIGSFGNQQVAQASGGFPVWQLYFRKGPPSPELARELASSKYAYLVIDRRMARYTPQVGVYFTAGEPVHRPDPRPPAAALVQYDDVPWATRIYSTTNIAVYRLDLAWLRAWST